MDSEDYRDQLKDTLNSTVNMIDVIYYSIKDELEKEILGKKDIIKIKNDEIMEIYNILNNKICETLIKSKLPLRIRFFNKVGWKGHGIYNSDKIIIYFTFNDNMYDNFQYIFELWEIKGLLKIK